MIGVSRSAVWTAGVALFAAAGVGGYLGYSRAVAAPGGAVDEESYATPLQAKKASAVDAAVAPPPVDETYIRKIAHDEAETILHPPKKVVTVAKADNSDDSSDDNSDDKTPPPSTPAAAKPLAPSAITVPPPPPTGLY